ncbi:MAG: SDR family oxidoreductase, partial [Pseudomonadota bacterium]
AMGVDVSTQTCDVRSLEEVRTLARHAVDTHGALDIWVNNAGIGYIMKPLLEVTEDDWRAVIDVNLSGAFFGVKAAAEQMVEAGKGGRIVNIASQAAKSGFPHAQAYTSSKHGLVGLVRSAATELGSHGITVNNVCPNHVTTGLGAWQNEYFAEVVGADSVEDYLAAMAARIPMGRPGLPEDTANAVAWLCTDEAKYITAESMNVSGGEEPH